MRTRKSTRKPLTWLSAISTLKTRTRLWLPPLICSSSSSSSSSVRPPWMAFSYNACLPPSCAPPSFSPLLIYLTLPTATLKGYDNPRLPSLSLVIIREIDLIIIMIMKNVNTGARVCVCPTWAKFFSLVSQFVKVSLIILSCAELTSAPEPQLFAQAPASPTRGLSL